MFSDINFRSKKELVYKSLHKAILEGSLKPGQRLVIEDLAAKLGVSQIPVREALQQLQATGFVVIEPNVGAKVSEIHKGLISEIFDLLEALETISSRVACQHMKDQDLDELEVLLHEMDTLINSPDRWSEANARFHLFICERGGTLLVHSLMMTTVDHWDRLRRQYPEGLGAQPMHTAQEEHWQLLDALRKRNADQVEQVVRAHNQSARAAYAGFLDEVNQKLPLHSPVEMREPDRSGRTLAP